MTALFAGEEIATRAAVAKADPANPREMVELTVATVGAHLGPSLVWAPWRLGPPDGA